jgi:hypothetical protein
MQASVLLALAPPLPAQTIGELTSDKLAWKVMD